MSASYCDAIFMLGDSLTQAAFPGSLTQRMAEHWLRRLDVLNRGYGGYNTVWGVEAFKQAFGTKADRAAGRAQKIPLLTVWYGANDSVLEGRPQFVEENDYGERLSEIVFLVTDESSEYYSPETKIILIGVTPIIEEDRLKAQIERWKEFGSKGDPPTLDRDLINSESYRDAPSFMLQELYGEEENVTDRVTDLDAWGAIKKAAGGVEPDQLRPFYLDGLHLNAKGYEVIFNEILKIIEEKWPELKPENIPMRIPHWSEIDVNNLAACMAPKPKADKPKDNGKKHDRDEDEDGDDSEEDVPLKKKKD